MHKNLTLTLHWALILTLAGLVHQRLLLGRMNTFPWNTNLEVWSMKLKVTAIYFKPKHLFDLKKKSPDVAKVCVAFLLDNQHMLAIKIPFTQSSQHPQYQNVVCDTNGSTLCSAAGAAPHSSILIMFLLMKMPVDSSELVLFED